MPYTISLEPGGAVKTFTGHVTGAEVSQSLVKLQSDSACDDLLFSINDFSQVDSFSVDESDLVDFAARSIGARAFNPRVRVMVITHRPDIMDLVDQYKQMGNGQVLVFTTLAQARDWLATKT